MKRTISNRTNSFFVEKRKRTSSFLNGSVKLTPFNIKGMRNETESFLKGTLTTLVV